MHQQSRAKEFRKKAAESLHAAHNTTDAAKRSDYITKANGYNALASAEEWIDGAPNKPSRKAV